MAYSTPANQGVWYTKWTNTTADVTTSTGDGEIFDVPKDCRIVEAGIVIATTVANDTVQGIVALDYRPTYGSDTGRVAKATFTLPDAQAAGSVLRTTAAQINTTQNLTPFTAVAGSQLVWEVPTAGTDGSSAAGAYFGYVVYELDPDDSANQTNVTEVSV